MGIYICTPEHFFSVNIYIYIFKKSEYSSILVVKIIMKKKGDENQDTKTSLIDDVYLQVCHVKKNFNMPYAFHCLFTDLQGPEKNIFLYYVIK